MLHSSFTGYSSLVLMWNGGFCIVGWFNIFLHGNLGNFGMATRGKLYCCSFSSIVFYLGYFRVCLTWEFASMVVVGATVHSCSRGGVLAILLPQLQLAQVSDFLFLMRIVNCNV